MLFYSTPVETYEASPAAKAYLKPKKEGNMKKILLATLLVSATAQAGKFEIIGEGVASKAAEFIRVQINIKAECHTSALAARKDVDTLAQKTVSVLGGFKADIPDQVIVSPEANLQQIKTAYVNGETVVICDEAHAWTSASVIDFKLDDLQQLAELQDSLLKLNPGSVKETNVSRLALTLGRPNPGVLALTWDEMSDLALQRAHQNALRQVKVLTLGMVNPTIELAKVSAASSGSSGQLIYDRVDSEGDSGGNGLGLVSVRLARQFTFNVK